MNKRGQVTIFIIIAIIIVAMVLVFLLFKDKLGVFGPGVNAEENPSEFLKVCLEDSIKENVEVMIHQGGFMENPLNKTFKFDEENKFYQISYLCYNQANYLPCVNQHPAFSKEVGDELSRYTEVRTCFDSLVKSLKGRGYEVEEEYNGFEIKFVKDNIQIEIDGELVLTKSEETSKLDKIKILIPSDLYDFVFITNEIVNKEALSCEFNYIGYQTLYPDYVIDRTTTEDGTEIYTITNRLDEKKWFRFAVRGCVIPAGA